MQLKELKPRKALNKAFLKVKPNRTEIEGFKTNLIALLDRTNDTESEEFHKNLVIDFLKKTYYDPNHYINTKGRNDLVIHNGQNANSTVGVIIEAKKPTNKTEMITTKKLNAKAFQELVLYYLRERITHKNLEVKHLVATNINEWFIFDATLFDRLFAQNKNFVKQFSDFEGGRLADTKTDFFYKQIAEPFIADLTAEIEFTYFNIQDFQKPLRNSDKSDDNALIALFKLLSPEHLLKLPFTNDSNSLDKRFYSELLHIIGLTETKEGSKKLIERNKEGERNTGTILEDAIIQLDSLDKLSRLERPNQFGSTTQERIFNVALELSITWINRILFLKLLEAQLITYHKGDKSYSFLSLDKIKNYDDLNSLFFQVLARKYKDRNEDVKKIFEKVPYLNSSLFEPTNLEQDIILISNLRDDKTIPVHSQTVLKDLKGKKRTGNLSTLEYLFEFLNAYDFSSEGSEEIQEDNKTLINASVLGLIFEKINGYKDGSFFTPGFITMYMCRETIRKAVVQKFNETENWNCTSIEDLYDKIENRKEANDIVNSIKICDPAVGSGHFLVSALNEMIAVKNDLKILQDREGKRLKEYHVEVVNDELIVTDEEGELFEYTPTNKESQRIQEMLFHEKQTIIENCLFGVDINSNSVKICRLRLWIELLKNAYYKNATELETLPNIDINIKCGNSLVSRFSIDADLKQALKKSKWTIDSYRIAVDTYRNAESKEQKREMERLIADIKSDFRSEISLNDPKVKKLRKLTGDLFTMTNQTQLFEMNKKEKADWNKKVKQLTEETKILETEIEEIKANKIFENAFEWRFEFPEVLNDDGDFVGFDVVIGNPPYVEFKDLDKTIKNQLEIQYVTAKGKYDIYIPFFELVYKCLKINGTMGFITPTRFMIRDYGSNLRNFIKQQFKILQIIDFGDVQIFESAMTYTGIFQLEKKTDDNYNFEYLKQSIDNTIINPKFLSISDDVLIKDVWNFTNDKNNLLLEKIRHNTKMLIDVVDGISQGIASGKDEVFFINQSIIDKWKIEREVIRPILKGKDINRFNISWSGKYVIYPYDFQGKPISEKVYETKFPNCFKYLTSCKDQLNGRNYFDNSNKQWFELWNQRKPATFEKEKIVTLDNASKNSFALDDNSYYGTTTVYSFSSNHQNLKNKYLLALINSKVLEYYHKLNSIPQANGFYRYQAIFIKSMPIKIASSTKQEQFINLVDKVLAGKIKNIDTINLENQIDQLVYQLYDLTEEEINIVEGK